MTINVVLNDARKEYWVADQKYSSKINYYINQLQTIYGEDCIRSYPTDLDHLNEDIKTDIHRGYAESHYSDWMIIESKEKK